MNTAKILDPNWRVENLYQIVDKNGQRIKLKRNIAQRIIAACPSKRRMILKSRQIGVSTERLITKFDKTIFRPNTTCAIIAHEKDAIEKLFRIPTRAYKFMPDDIKPVLDRGGGSKFEMYFPEINSRIYCDLEVRGDTAQILHVSEAAFMKDSSRLKATLQAVPLNGEVDIETTPNGMGNFFYEMWNDPDQPYEKLFFPWFMFPQYRMPAPKNMQLTDEEVEFIGKALRLFNLKIDNEQIAFRRHKRAELKASVHDKVRVTFEQEYPEDDRTCFLASGQAVMDLFVVKDLMDKAQAPIFDNGWMRLYDSVDKHARYVCGADTAEGVGGDSSVGVMIDAKNLKVVGVINSNKWKPSEFAEKLDEFCRKFQGSQGRLPELAVERNNHGHAVLLKLEEYLKYPSLFHRVTNKESGEKDLRPGWVTDAVTRPIMINAFIDAVENRHLNVSEKYILSECLTLINNGGKIEAADNKHDDFVVATSIALQLCLSGSNLDLYDSIEKKILL